MNEELTQEQERQQQTPLVQDGDPNKTVQTPPAQTVTPQIDKFQKQAQLKSFWDSYNQGVSDFTHNVGPVTSQNSRDEFFYNRPNPYNPESLTNINQNFERYYTHGSYAKLGFNPWRDNEELYNSKGSAWGDVGRAMIAGSKLIPTGFMSAVRSWGDMFSGDALEQDEQSAAEMKKYTTIGMSTKGGFTGFMSNLMTSAGYTVGIGLEMAAEGVVAAALAPETGAGSVAVWGERAAMAGKNIGKIFNVVEGFNKAMNTMRNFNESKNVWEALRGGAQFLNPLSKTTEAINVLRTSENLTDLAKISKTAGAFHKDMMLINATLAESKLEGGMVTQDMRDQLTNTFYLENGRLPQTKEELDQIEKTAKEAGDKTLLWNIPGIWLTNKITFDPLFKRFGRLSEDVALRGGRQLLLNPEKGFEMAGEGFAAAMRGLLKPKTYGKAALNYFKSNLSEGTQESLQEIISGTARDYYTDVYKNNIRQGHDQNIGENYNIPDIESTIGKNVVDQFSGKGFETFASGFFMGGLIHPLSRIVHGANLARTRLFNKKEYEDYQTRRKEYEEKTVTALNDIYRDPAKYFGAGLLNLGNAGNTVENQDKANRKNNRKDFYDVTDQSVWSHLMTAFETNTAGIFMDKLRSIKSMTPQAIEEAYPGTNGQEVQSKIDDMIERGEFLKKSYDTWNNMAPNPYTPAAYRKGTPEYDKEMIAYRSWEQAKAHAIFYGYSMQRNLERVANIQKSIRDTKSFEGMSGNDLNVLLDVPSLNKELGVLSQEIKDLRTMAGAQAREDLAKRQRKFELLSDFRKNLQNYFITQHLSETPEAQRGELAKGFKDFEETTDKQLKKSFSNYLKHIAAQNNTLYMSDIDADEAYAGVKDAHKLKSEVQNMSGIVNMLSNPEGFRAHQERLNSLFTDMWANKEKDLAEGVNKTYDRIEANQLLNNLYRLGFVVDADQAQQIFDKQELPESFYNVVAKQTVNKGDPDYERFEFLVNDYLSARKGEPVAEETPVEAEAQPAAAEEQKPQGLTDTEKATLQKELAELYDRTRDKMAGVYNSFIQQGKTEDEANALTEKQWLTTPEGRRAAEIEALLAGKTEKPVTKPAEQEPARKPKSKAVFNLEERLAKIQTGEDLQAFEAEMVALFANYDKTDAAGITAEIQKELMKAIADKNRSLIEGFNPDNLQKGNVVIMNDKGNTKALVTKVTDKFIIVQLISEDGQDISKIINRDNIKKNIKYKLSDTMREESVPKPTDKEEKNIETNHQLTDEFSQDPGELRQLQEQAEKEGVDKVNSDFENNLGCGK